MNTIYYGDTDGDMSEIQPLTALKITASTYRTVKHKLARKALQMNCQVYPEFDSNCIGGDMWLLIIFIPLYAHERPDFPEPKFASPK